MTSYDQAQCGTGFYSEVAWLKGWYSLVGHRANLRGYTSTGKSIAAALEYSGCAQEIDPASQSVLFVFLIKNHNGYLGFRLTTEQYSPYHQEQEYLLMEGFDIWILDIQADVVINNTHQEVA